MGWEINSLLMYIVSMPRSYEQCTLNLDLSI